MSWKKNFRKTPSHILQKLNQLDSDELVVGCVKSFLANDLKEGILSHLQISVENGILTFPESILPPPNQGKFSNWNIYGRIIKRYDLPKENYYISHEAPNWGDSYKGTHTVTIERERYQRDFIAPRHNVIFIDCPDNSENRDSYLIKFQLSEILYRGTGDFEDRLFYCINLLQENVGACDLVRSDATFNDYIRTLNLSWDILPPGSLEETLSRLFRNSNPTQQDIDTATERYRFFNSLRPINLIIGVSGFQRYFGAMIRDNLVFFENVRYGNAIYIMFENWQVLSQKSRIDLLSGEQIGFERIIHTGDWKTQVRSIIRRKLRNR